jgi:anti-anti-sigma factor
MRNTAMLFSTELLIPPDYSHEKLNTEKLILKILLSGAFNAYNSLELYEFIKTINEGGLHNILLGLNDLKDIDSSGIGVLQVSAALLKSSNGEIIIFDVPDKISKIFRVVKLDSMIKIFNSVDDSLSYFKAK